jgi:hypothetical protein
MKLKYIISIIMFVMILGCAGSTEDLKMKPLSDNIQYVIENNDDVLTNSMDIQKSSNEVGIVKKSKVIEEKTIQSQEILKKTKSGFNNTGEYISKLESENKTYKEDIQKSMDSTFNFVILISLLLVVAGICCVVFFNKAFGFSISLLGIISASIFKFYLMKPFYFVYFGLAVLLIIILYTFYRTYQIIKSNKENITLIDVIKDKLSINSYTNIFGDKKSNNQKPSIADTIQSKSTKKIVSDVKCNLRTNNKELKKIQLLKQESA